MQNQNKFQKVISADRQGFTLVELLLVIGIIATLAVVAFVALDPAKRFQDARDARRVSDVETVLSAVHQYVIDNGGTFPSGLDDSEKQMGTGTADCGISTGDCLTTDGDGCIDLSSVLAKYLKNLPYDPKYGSAEYTHYTIVKNTDGIVTVTACDTEGSETSIAVSR